ncbi:DUF4303 domain-containing protein [Pseudomonas sp. RIT-PI-S]|uniref:DUF4303 domain-containing protein n=1 Tax=Pseudomonas sp. RIT-PI-S TaxID=3035295 RepID=UPI0021DA970D|nr:DUF4303 domain-containing protein [Pseudomonas sp. RIT-PI-S]
MNNFDLDALEENLRLASLKTIKNILSIVPESDVCGFALYSDIDIESLAPAFNTKKHLQAMQIEDPDDSLYYKWSPAEWSHEFFGAEYFGDISREIISLGENLKGDEYNAFKLSIPEICVRVLNKLRINHFSNAIFIFSVTDFRDLETECAWIKSINNKHESTEFELWLKSI